MQIYEPFFFVVRHECADRNFRRGFFPVSLKAFGFGVYFCRKGFDILIAKNILRCFSKVTKGLCQKAF